MNDQSFVHDLIKEAEAPQKPSAHGRRGVTILVVLVLVGGSAWFLRSSVTELAQPQRTTQAAPPPAPAVRVAIATRRNVPVLITGLGTVQPFNSITVKPRVGGELKDIVFTEGQMVHTGEVLAHIDPSVFLPPLHQAEANLAKDEAQLKNTNADLQRTASLAQGGYATGQALDTQKAQLAVLQATVLADHAAVENAQTQLDFTNVTSPIDGVAGLRMIDAGNMIATSDPGLVVINQLEPIAVIFTVPSEAVGHWAVGLPTYSVAVAALSADGQRTLGTGTLSLIDNHVDPTTATIKLKASFPNADHQLKPGQFVNARMQSLLLHDVVTVPTGAVQEGTAGPWVFAVGPNDTLEQRSITVTRIAGGLAVIGAGLSAGEVVVSGGQYGLTPGQKVTVAPGPQASAGGIKANAVTAH